MRPSQGQSGRTRLTPFSSVCRFGVSLRARKLSKELSIRLPVRPIGTAEDALSWVRDRDVGVVLMELNFLTAGEAKRCADKAARGLLCDGGKSLLAWVGGVALPNGIATAELTPTLAAEHLDARLLEVVVEMFPMLRDQTNQHGRKRKMNIAAEALESAKVTRTRKNKRRALRKQWCLCWDLSWVVVALRVLPKHLCHGQAAQSGWLGGGR